MATPTKHQISEMLVKHETNLCAWAKAHGYIYMTVFNTVNRWAGRDDRTPHGGLARLIMRDLAADVEAAECRNSDAVVATEVATHESSVATHNRMK